MITLIRAAYQTQFKINEFAGKSTDTKPKKNTSEYNLNNGDTLYCMDDQTTFMYDIDTDEWIEQ